MRKALLLVLPAVALTIASTGHTDATPAALVPLVPLAKIAAAAAAKCPAHDAHGQKTGQNANTCADDVKNGKPFSLCAVYSPAHLRSDKCRAEKLNGYLTDADGHPVDTTLFGKNDCRAYGATRALASIDRVVIHNGGFSGAMNEATWECRPAASHYTIDPFGKIFQHMGEEMVAPNAKSPGDDSNKRSIGIELNIGKAHGVSCNSLDGKAKDADVRAACTPTAKQYESLNRLLRVIALRTSVKLDESHVVGHCEIDDENHKERDDHSDPRVFDWSKVSMSNATKKAGLAAQLKAGKSPNCLSLFAVP